MTAQVVRRGAIGSLIWRHYGERRHATKLLARDAQVSTRTAEKWREGRCEPTSSTLVTLMGHNAALRDDIFRLTQNENTIDRADAGAAGVATADDSAA